MLPLLALPIAKRIQAQVISKLVNMLRFFVLLYFAKSLQAGVLLFPKFIYLFCFQQRIVLESNGLEIEVIPDNPQILPYCQPQSLSTSCLSIVCVCNSTFCDEVCFSELCVVDRMKISFSIED